MKLLPYFYLPIHYGLLMQFANTVMYLPVRNGNPCRCCDENYRKSTTSIRVYEGGKSKNKSKHVMWPFYGCVSYELVENGRCGNCWWLGKRCSWTDVDEGHPAWDSKAREAKDWPKVAERLGGGEMSRLVPMVLDGAFKR